jgi:predicted Zn-dependent peptidase
VHDLDAHPIEKSELKNGVRVLSMRMPHLRSVAMGVWVDAGARDECDDEAGLSHFIEHMIFKGTHKRSAFEIAKAFDAIGGATNAFTGMENTCYHARVMDEHLATMVEILTDIFLNSAFDQRELERERTVIFSEIAMLEDSPDDLVHHLIASTFWGGHPLGRSILGSRDNLITVDANRLRRFFHRIYQPDRIVIAAAGSVDHAELVDQVRDAFETVSASHVLPERTAPVAQSKVHCAKRDIEQVHFCLSTGGVPANDPKRFALSLLSTLLGGNMSSRLFQKIREQLGLAYALYAYAHTYADTGMFGVYAAVAPEQMLQVVEAVTAEMRRVKETPIDPAELASAKAFTRSNLLMAAESNDNQMIRLAQNEITLQSHPTLAETIAQVEAVSAAQIQDLANELFDDTRLALASVGPFSDSQALAQCLRL